MACHGLILFCCNVGSFFEALEGELRPREFVSNRVSSLVSYKAYLSLPPLVYVYRIFGTRHSDYIIPAGLPGVGVLHGFGAGTGGIRRTPMNVVDLCAVVPFFVMVAVLPVMDVRALAAGGVVGPGTAGARQPGRGRQPLRRPGHRGELHPRRAAHPPLPDLQAPWPVGVSMLFRLGRYSTGLKMMMVALGGSTVPQGS